MMKPLEWTVEENNFTSNMIHSLYKLMNPLYEFKL